MFFYIYDSFLKNSKYDKFHYKINTRLTSLGISGRPIHLSILKNLKDIIDNIPEKESPTIAVVGDDKIFYKAAKYLIGRKTPLGFIPVNKNSTVAKLLGIPTNEFACDVLSARLVEAVGLGLAENENFFSYVEAPANEVIVECDGLYRLQSKKMKKIRVVNLGLLKFSDPSEVDTKKMVANPNDEALEIIIGNPESRFLFKTNKEIIDSVLLAKEITLKKKDEKSDVNVLIDGEKSIPLPITIKLSPDRVRLIVGRNRLI
jgi:diacylglycerol kinase family enzyme